MGQVIKVFLDLLGPKAYSSLFKNFKIGSFGMDKPEPLFCVSRTCYLELGTTELDLGGLLGQGRVKNSLKC